MDDRCSIWSGFRRLDRMPWQSVRANPGTFVVASVLLLGIVATGAGAGEAVALTDGSNVTGDDLDVTDLEDTTEVVSTTTSGTVDTTQEIGADVEDVVDDTTGTNTESEETVDEDEDDSETEADGDSDTGADATTDEHTDSNTDDGTTTDDVAPTDDGAPTVTETVEETVENTNEIVGSTVENASGAVEGTVQNTNETLDSTAENASGTVESTVENTNETVSSTAENTNGTLSSTVDNANGTVERTVQNTNETLDSTVQNTSGTVEETVENTNETVEGTVQNVSGAVTPITRTVNETVESTNGILGAITEELVDQSSTLLSTADSIVDVTTTPVSPDDSGTGSTEVTVDERDGIGEPAVRIDDAPEPAFESARPPSRGGGGIDRAVLDVEDRPSSDDVGLPPSSGAIGLGAVVIGTLARRGVAVVNVGPDALRRGLSSLRPPSAGDGSWRVRFWRSLASFRYSRHDDSDPLEHDERAALYDRVRASPGVNLSSLAEETDVPLSTARHHLRVLKREGLVEDRRIGGKRRFAPRGVDNDERTAALHDEATAQVLRAIARHGSASVSTLAADLDRDPSTVVYHLKGLEEIGLVERNREGRAVVNRLTRTAQAMLDTRIDPAGTGSPAETVSSYPNDHRGTSD